MCACPSLWYTKWSSLSSTASAPQAPTPTAYSATSLQQANTQTDGVNRETELVRARRSVEQAGERERTSRRRRRRSARKREEEGNVRP
jgi:hypothetical protein